MTWSGRIILPYSLVGRVEYGSMWRAQKIRRAVRNPQGPERISGPTRRPEAHGRRVNGRDVAAGVDLPAPWLKPGLDRRLCSAAAPARSHPPSSTLVVVFLAASTVFFFLLERQRCLFFFGSERNNVISKAQSTSGNHNRASQNRATQKKICVVCQISLAQLQTKKICWTSVCYYHKKRRKEIHHLAGRKTKWVFQGYRLP